MSHSFADFVSDGAIHRAVVAAIEWIGDDAIVDFRDLDQPGRIHRVAMPCQVDFADLAEGDECLIRFRNGRNIARPAHWDLVERCHRGPIEGRKGSEKTLAGMVS
jgi:hypothetical protein